ncbi:DUF4870 domain-containing protein [Pseudogracilibacillus auburnensis]|uniref:Putative membrane protein n=1 Tax=Pseudogracilibacillus auburnensis TaxID=1494959 RepID=A0A2V3VFY5_9BACI|nr:DUF4870 domain-containing protein [Pseudogracilibacillus auburnensis]MBO1005295.1 DUF4870 domain-containing protein [Pseudogracilibacillus auburnensis]PXW80490.1 putative membrane protein [Pseudogracilibacillus auburnensis]
MTDPKSKKQTVFKDVSEEYDNKEKITLAKTHSGLQENLAGALCYLAWAMTGIVFLFIEKENHFIRFHAFQSIILSIAVFVLGIVLAFIPIIGLIFSLILAPAVLFLWIFMMWKAYQGEMFKLPITGEMAEKQISK